MGRFSIATLVLSAALVAPALGGPGQKPAVFPPVSPQSRMGAGASRSVPSAPPVATGVGSRLGGGAFPTTSAFRGATSSAARRPMSSAPATRNGGIKGPATRNGGKGGRR